MRFRFSIRDLLWLTALAAVAVAWWLDHRAFVTRDDPVAETYSLKNTASKDVGGILQSVFANTPGVQIAVDMDRNSVIVLARPTRQVEIRGFIDELDRPMEPITAWHRLTLGTGVSAPEIKAKLQAVLGIQPG
jgi:Bacterial type II/III secretion system short domain